MKCPLINHSIAKVRVSSTDLEATSQVTRQVTRPCDQHNVVPCVVMLTKCKIIFIVMPLSPLDRIEMFVRAKLSILTEIVAGMLLELFLQGRCRTAADAATGNGCMGQGYGDFPIGCLPCMHSSAGSGAWGWWSASNFCS